MSAPELSVQLARRALLVGATDASAATTNVGAARILSMRAQAALAAGLVRVSQHAKAVEPGFTALALAEAGGALDVAAEVRINLAACAQQVGEPLLGGAILRPVLESVHTPPAVRAAALGRLVGCVAHVARRDDVEDSLAEADRLLAADDGMSADVRRMERARLAVRSAAYHRWYGDTEDAITAAREGLNLLTRSRSDLRSESDRLRARLVLELVCGLLDEGELREAEDAAHPIVDEPVRATSAASVGRLMLAVATRLHLPSGRTDRGRHLLDQAAWLAERHALDGLLADALTEVSRLDEQAGRAADALQAMRTARAAEHRRMRSLSRAARHVLVEVGANHGVRDTTQQEVASLMRSLAHPAGLPGAVTQTPRVSPAAPSPEPQAPPAAAELAGTVDMDETTHLLDREGLIRRLRAVGTGERPVALTLVRFEPTRDGVGDRGPDTGIMAGLADKVRDMAPDNAELARSDGGELAVFLPATTRDQAEEFAATIRETAIESDWAGASGKDLSISTGVAQTDQPTGDDNVDAAGILTAARDALTPAQAATGQNPPVDTAAALQSALPSALSDDTPTTPLTNTGRPENRQDRSILSSLSIPSGSGGRRRAGEEQAPGGKSRWPAEPAEAPRWTRAERRALEQTTWPAEQTPPAGWPAATEEPSQGKRAATPTRPSFSETRTDDTTRGIDRTQLPPRHDTAATPEAPSTPDPAGPAARTNPTPATGEPAHIAEAIGQHGGGTGSSGQSNPFDAPANTVGAERSGGDAGVAGRATSFDGSAGAGRGSEASTTFDSTAQAGAARADAAAAPQHGGTSTVGGVHTTNPETSFDVGSGAGVVRPSAEPVADAAARPELSFDGGVGAGVVRPAAESVADAAARTSSPELSFEGGVGAGGARPWAELVAGAAARTSSPEPLSDSGTDAGGVRPWAESVADAASPESSFEAGVGADVVRPSAESSAGGTARASSPESFDAQAVGRRSSAESHREAASAEVRTSRPELAFAQQGGSADSAPSAARAARSAGGVGAVGEGEHDLPSSGPSGEVGLLSSLAGAHSGGTLRAQGTSERSSYEETKAELARMMSALNAKSLEARGRNGARQSIPTPPTPDEMPEPPHRPDVPEPADPDPIPPVPEPGPETNPDISPEPGQRSGLMAAFDALTGPVPGLRAEFDDAAELPARRPAKSWAELQSSAVVESPADELFGSEVAEKPRFRSSLGAAFAEFGADDPTEKNVTEPVKETVQETTYDEPIGPPPRPNDLPRRGERSSATIASLLTEALAAYQSTAEDTESHRTPERFDSFVGDDSDRPPSGVRGRHRSPE